jgi:isopenicillin N synthase-like dioxygenase
MRFLNCRGYRKKVYDNVSTLRPRGTTPVTNIRSIDLSQSDSQCAAELRDAFTNLGFAYVTNHQIPQTLCTELEATARAFFRTPVQSKNSIAMSRAGRAWRGYFPVGGEYTAGKRDQKEGLYFGQEHAADSEGVIKHWPMHGQNQWPSEPQLAPVVLEYMQSMQQLGQRLMGCVALSLGLEQQYFAKRFTSEPTTLFRIFNYPKQPHQTTDWGVGEHTDMGFLTILLQDNLGGLEVRDRHGHWLKAPPMDGTFIINIGDMLQHWTHGIYKATLHRVRNTSGVDRLSFPYFFDPNWACKLHPIDPTLLNAELLNQARKDPFRQRWDGLDLSSLDSNISYGDFVWNKIKHVFPDLATQK